MRKEALSYVKNFSRINDLPQFKDCQNEDIHTSFFNEEVIIKPLDYYFSNAISRASKTMSECRQVNQKHKKTELTIDD